MLLSSYFDFRVIYGQLENGRVVIDVITSAYPQRINSGKYPRNRFRKTDKQIKFQLYTATRCYHQGEVAKEFDRCCFERTISPSDSAHSGY